MRRVTWNNNNDRQRDQVVVNGEEEDDDLDDDLDGDLDNQDNQSGNNDQSNTGANASQFGDNMKEDTVVENLDLHGAKNGATYVYEDDNDVSGNSDNEDRDVHDTNFTMN